jgi:hypothetical protein
MELLSGGLLTRRARAMRIEGRIERTFGRRPSRRRHITPSRALGGTTPYEKLNQALGKPNMKPNIAHIKVYGCKAYRNLPKISKKRKMAARTNTGYLVGTR